MANTIGKSILALRGASSLEECALRLCAVARDSAVDQECFTDAALRATRIGSLPTDILALWASITLDTPSIIQCLRQQDSGEACRAAISNFARALTHDNTFDAPWEAIGGTAGFVAFLDALPAYQVSFLCRKLTKGVKAVSGQKRQQACKELLAVLCPEKADVTMKRPLQNIYHRLVLACNLDTALDWDGRICIRLRKQLRQIHGEAFLARTLDACFPSSTAREVSNADFVCLQVLIVQDRARYGLAVLERLAATDKIPQGLKTSEVVDKLIMLVIRHTPREGGRKIGRETSASLWKVITSCFEKHFGLRAHLKSLRRRGKSPDFVIARLVHDWGRFGGDADHEVSLTKLINLVPKTATIESSTRIVLPLVPPYLRYQLLRLFFQHAKNVSIDIDPLYDNQTTISDTKRLGLSLDVIFILPPNDARRLAQRLLASDCCFRWISGSLQQSDKSYGYQLLGLKNSLLSDEQDTHMLQALLQSVTGVAGALNVADELLLRKNVAQKSKLDVDRAALATSAIALSIATGDLRTYSATLDWSKRFARDPLVRYRLCSWDMSRIQEAVNLLCVVPPKSLIAFSSYENSALTADLEKASQILAHYVQQAMDATREPGFSGWHWRNAFTLITEVVYQRLARVNAWQDCFSISDSEVVELLWEPTLKTLIDVERQLLVFGNTDLCLNARQILYTKTTPTLSYLRTPSLLFLDGLSKARDDLWESYRVERDPRVASLGVPWPRGLPLHETVRYMVEGPASLAYMEERARSIVFGRAAAYLHPLDDVDDNTRAAIGDFVENWPEALKIYIRGAPGEERKLRIQSAWDYANSLSKGQGMSRRQIRDFWIPFFERAGADIPPLDTDKIEILPCADFPLSSPSLAWNPMNAPAILTAEKDVKVERLCLDLVLGACSFSGAHAYVSPGISGPLLYWELATSQKDPSRPAIDSYISTAALVLNTLHGSAPLLAEPFPSSDPAEVRFPAMSVDPLFASTDNILSAETVLRHFVRQTPGILLSRLASSILGKVLELSGTTTGDDTNQCLQTLVFVFKLLQKRSPAAAADLATKAVLGLPHDSSWHRVLLNDGLFRRLSPSRAEETLQELLDGFQQRFEATGTASALEGNDKQQGPFIKITTVKLVAQMMRHCAVFSPASAVDTLIRLFRTTTHISVHREAARILISTAKSLPDGGTVQENIIQALSTYVVPRASSLNEDSWQRALTEHDWQSVEAREASLSELGNCDGRDGEMLNTLIDACKTTQPPDNPNHPQLHSALLNLLEAALLENGRLHRRWLKAFIVREKLAVWSEEIESLLPAIPVCYMGMLGKVFSCGLIRADIFRAMSQLILQKIEAPAALAAMTSRVYDDVELRNSHAGRHWRTMWKREVYAFDFSNLGGTWAVSTLLSPVSTPDALLDCDVDTLANFVRDVAFAFFHTRNSSKNDCFRMFIELLIQGEREALSKDARSIHGEVHCGRGKGIAVLRLLSSEIDRMRSQPSWRQNPDRKPVSLPSSFEWKYIIWQCSMPTANSSLLESGSSLVDSTVALVTTLVEDHNTPYHLAFQKLKDWFHKEGQGRESSPDAFWTGLVVGLGTVGVTTHHVWGTLIRCLCADLAFSYLAGFDSGITRDRRSRSLGETRLQVQDMVESWKRSDVEFLWDRANQILSTHMSLRDDSQYEGWAPDALGGEPSNDSEYNDPEFDDPEADDWACDELGGNSWVD